MGTHRSGPRRTLHTGWTLTAEPQFGSAPGAEFAGVPAGVPGCVHTDLLAAGLIEDPYIDDNENRLGWIGQTAWTYETTFPWHPDGAQHTDLVCEGLDTAAAVVLNGAEVARTANMHRSYRFPIRHLLRAGPNVLQVRFAAQHTYAQAQRAQLGARPGAYAEPYQYIRKMACNFGWDWGPTLVTAGIWRPIGLHEWSVARLAQVRPVVTVDGTTGRVEVHVTVERGDSRPLTVSAEITGLPNAQVALAEGESAAVVALTVPDAELWWPRGFGPQPRYSLTVRLADGETAIDRWHRRIGFRTVELDTADDAHGSAFTLVVNGSPVFIRGANWIPDDCFPSRVGRDRLATRFAQACEANLNLLRVWGGGRYESEDFYELADERGLLVWQDFPFACAAYPEEEPLRTEVELEARENVVRLAPHPSLVLWCGNNENIEGFHEWGWQAELAGRSWGAGYYFELLPGIVKELDPTRPYWPGSPYSGDPDRRPNDPAHGTVHLWDVWNNLDYTHYAHHRPRFAAEYGFQGPPAYATLRRALTDEPLRPDSPGLRHHQKAIDGNAKLLRGLADHLPAPAAFDDWHYRTQLNQARAVTFAIEHLRALAPLCMGSVVWQLNDCWPVTSWAAIDGDGRRKPLWYALRRGYADRLLTIQRREAGLVVVACNDTDGGWESELSVRRLALTGEPLAKETFPVCAAPRQVVTVPLPHTLVNPADATSELLVADLGGVRTERFFAEDTAVAFPEAAYDAVAEPVAGGVRVTVVARTILRDLALFPDRLDPAAEVDDMLHTLLPGETATFQISTGRRLDGARLTSYPVLRCVNEAGAGSADR